MSRAEPTNMVKVKEGRQESARPFLSSPLEANMAAIGRTDHVVFHFLVKVPLINS